MSLLISPSNDPLATPALAAEADVRAASPRRLTEQDAIDIWIARWLRVRRKTLIARYGCDPRRIYEIWEGTRHPGSRAKALEVLRERYPGVPERIDLGRHRRIPRAGTTEGQLGLFDDRR